MIKNKKISLITCGFFLIFCLGFSLSPALAAEEMEKILNFESLITVNSDSSLTVEETITVLALGVEIKRGIYRDFPTHYKDYLGNNYNVSFEVLEVLRDGSKINYWTERLSNGIRTYLGDKDIYIPKGQYAYTLKYKTTRQLGNFSDHDELYWNVTGQGWVFPIERASARIILPEGMTADQIKLDGYTGSSGSQAKNFTTEIIDNQPYFETTKPFNPYEGLTIVVGWPKGFVQEPTQKDEIIYWL